jgi:hypothetical protein
MPEAPYITALRDAATPSGEKVIGLQEAWNPETGYNGASNRHRFPALPADQVAGGLAWASAQRGWSAAAARSPSQFGEASREWMIC